MKKLTSALMAILIVMSVVPMTLFSASAASAVPSGAKEYNGHTYYVFKSSVSWTKAKQYCENRGGHLATITSAKENNFVASLIDKKGIKNCWLGASDSSEEGTWKWVTGETFKYNDWGSGQPDNYQKEEHYLQVENDIWNDQNNEDLNVQGYVCEWDMTKTKASSVRLNKSSATVYYKGTGTIKVLNTEKTVKWSSSDTKVAKVSSKGVVTGVGLGTCYIYAKVGSKTLKCKVTVKDRSSSATVSFKTNGGGYFIKGESSAIVKFKLKSYDCAKVYVYIKNSSGDTVYKKTFTKLTKGEYYSFTWNGKNSDGEYVGSGSYRVLVKAGSKKSYSAYLSFKAKNDFADGNGTKANPFIVASTSQLKKIVKYPTAYFKQSKDLDFNYTAVGGFFSEDQPFTGTYDGAGKTIKNISGTAALFDTVGEKGTIKNVKMSNCSVVGKDSALLVKSNYGKVQDCDVNGVVTVTLNRTKAILGIIANKNYGTVSNCISSGNVSATVSNGEIEIGGIVGSNNSNGKIIYCSSKANLSANATYTWISNCGGIAGNNSGVINNCETSGTITSTGSYTHDRPGAIAGTNNGQIMSSYYTGASSVNIAGLNEGVIA